jgi:hypothetical protein
LYCQKHATKVPKVSALRENEKKKKEKMKNARCNKGEKKKTEKQKKEKGNIFFSLVTVLSHLKYS